MAHEPRVALWCPSLGMACGIANYTAALGAALPEAVLTTEPPPAGTVDVVHVQHEFGVFPHAGMLAYGLQNLRNAGVKIVLTLHTVYRTAAIFEQFADAFGALSRQGAAQLAARAGDRPVRFLDHPCPAWQESPQPVRGVIGAHGYLERDKGFWELVDVLRDRPDLELRLLSHPRRPVWVEDFTRHIAGTRTTWIQDHLPLDEIVADLATTADVLVYWRHDLGNPYGSGSVRSGLASGVPVLTSRAPVFDDLGETVYRAQDLAQGLDDLLTIPELRAAKRILARRYVETHSWAACADAHRALYREVCA